MINDAHEYWSGYTLLDGIKIAVLFEGVFRIEEEIYI